MIHTDDGITSSVPTSSDHMTSHTICAHCMYAPTLWAAAVVLTGHIHTVTLWVIINNHMGNCTCDVITLSCMLYISLVHNCIIRLTSTIMITNSSGIKLNR